jgi:hypothetical protein
MNLYQYVRSSPVSRVDPSGAYSVENRVQIDFGEYIHYITPDAPWIGDNEHPGDVLDKFTSVSFSLQHTFEISVRLHDGLYDIDQAPHGNWRNLSGEGRLDVSEIDYRADSGLWKVLGKPPTTARKDTKRLEGRCVECAFGVTYIEYKYLADTSGIKSLAGEAVGLLPGGSVWRWVSKKAIGAMADKAIDKMFETDRRRLYVLDIVCADGKRWLGVYNLPRSQQLGWPLGAEGSYARHLSTRVTANFGGEQTEPGGGRSPAPIHWDQSHVEVNN